MTLFTYSVIFHPSPVSKVANNADEWCPRVQLKTNLLVMEGGDEVLSAEKLNLQRKKERKKTNDVIYANRKTKSKIFDNILCKKFVY